MPLTDLPSVNESIQQQQFLAATTQQRKKAQLFVACGMWNAQLWLLYLLPHPPKSVNSLYFYLLFYLFSTKIKWIDDFLQYFSLMLFHNLECNPIGKLYKWRIAIKQPFSPIISRVCFIVVVVVVDSSIKIQLIWRTSLTAAAINV